MNPARKVASFGGLALLAGCTFFTSWDGYSPESGAPSCHLARWPDRPSGGQGGGATELVGALKELRYFDSVSGTPPGLDLDGLCTCPDRGACVGGQGPAHPCDVAGSGGVDNAGGDVLNTLFREDQLQEGIASGLHGLAVRVEKYNGKPDDIDVTVSIYNIVGVNGATDGGAPPHFDGTDTIIVDDGSVSIGLASRYVDTSAYVSGGVLVAAFDFDLRMLIAPEPNAARLKLVEPIRSARLVGPIEATSAGLRMKNALLVGRIPLATMFSQAGPASSCSDAGIFQNIKDQLVCRTLDLPANPAADGTGAPCGALSFGFRLQVEPAKIGSSAKIDPDQPACPPIDDHCN